MRCGSTITTNIFINGNCMHSPFSMGNMYMNSCFFPPLMPHPAAVAGFACGACAPDLFGMIGKGFAWLGKSVIAPAASFVWNKALKPVGNFMWNSVLKPVGNFMWNSVLKPVGNFAWNSVLKPVGNFMWNSVLKPAGNFMWNSVIKPTGKFFGKVGSAIGKGVSSLWNKIFHKKSKTKTETA